MKKRYKFKLTHYQQIAIIYIALILLGAFILWLPISSKAKEFTPFINALFTSTSASCVTGISVYDTYSHWSLFGQITIMLLVQIGGIGFMTIITLFALFINKQINLNSRTLFIQSTGALDLGSITKLIKNIFIGTSIFEVCGIILLSIRFCPIMGFWEGLYNALFHTISAFCCAGFDLMGKFSPNTSLAYFANDVIVNFTLMFLTFMGSLGFIAWSDLLKNKYHWKKYTLHTKIVLAMTFLLIFIGTISFISLEYNNTLKNKSFLEKLMTSLFHAVMSRTTGISTIDIFETTESTRLIVAMLMIIGGSPGSTAGGIKTTTVAVILLSVLASATRNNTLKIFKKRLEPNITQQVLSIITLYVFAFMIFSVVIAAIEPYAMSLVYFEVLSALGTVGLSSGISANFSVLSKVLMILLMYGGRIGMATVMLIFAGTKKVVPLERPVEKILIG